MSLIENGGYQMVDLKNKSITTTEQVIDGAYTTIENSHRKTIMLVGLVVDGTKYNDLVAPMILGTNKYSFIYAISKTSKVVTFNVIEIAKGDKVKLSSFTCESAES